MLRQLAPRPANSTSWVKYAETGNVPPCAPSPTDYLRTTTPSAKFAPCPGAVALSMGRLPRLSIQAKNGRACNFDLLRAYAIPMSLAYHQSRPEPWFSPSAAGRRPRGVMVQQVLGVGCAPGFSYAARVKRLLSPEYRLPVVI